MDQKFITGSVTPDEVESKIHDLARSERLPEKAVDASVAAKDAGTRPSRLPANMHSPFTVTGDQIVG